MAVHGLKAQLRAYPPPLSVALGLAGKGVLERRQLVTGPLLASGSLLLTVWGAVAVLFFVTVVSFLLELWTDFRLLLIVLTTATAVVALLVTIYIARRAEGNSKEVSREGLAYFPWDFLMFTETAFIALALALVILLAAFVLFLFWLPLVLLAVNFLAFGELWRSYRTITLSSTVTERERLRRVGTAILGRGGVLSRTWDSYLDPGEARRANQFRRAHLRVHEALLLVGISSLFFAAASVASRVFPSQVWSQLLYAVGGLTVLFVVALLWTLYRRRILARPILPD